MQVVQHFLNWVETAKVAERAAAAAALARAYLDHEMAFEDRYAAEAALTMLLDDPSAKVRRAMSEALSMSRHAPVQVVSALAGDQPDVAAPVLARSPLLCDSDLVDRVAEGRDAIQCLVAGRPLLSMGVSAAIAEVGSARPCIALVENPGATIASLSFKRIVERFGHEGPVREVLGRDPRLPSDSRHLLMQQLGETLREAPLVKALVGANRAKTLTRDACIRASLTLIDHAPAEEHSALVEHLRLSGELSTAFLIRMVAHGKIDFLGAALVALSGQGHDRVRTLLAGGRPVAIEALLRKSGLAEAAHAPILTALVIWRDVATGKRVAGAQEVSWQMLNAIEATGTTSNDEKSELAGLLRTIHLDVLRENARAQARAIAAA